MALVTLRRPERRNALSIALRDALSDTLDALADDDAVSVVIITGEGPVFSARLRSAGVRNARPPTLRSIARCGRRRIAITPRCCSFRCR